MEKKTHELPIQSRDLLTRQKSTFYENQKHDLWDDLLPLLANPNKNPSKILLEPWKNPTKRILNMSKSAFFTIYHTFLNLFFIIWPLLNHVKHGEITALTSPGDARLPRVAGHLQWTNAAERQLLSQARAARKQQSRGGWNSDETAESLGTGILDYGIFDYGMSLEFGIWMWENNGTCMALIWDWNGIEI